MTPQLMHRNTTDDLVSEECPPASQPGATQIRTAIAKALFENPGDLDIRLLWTQGAITYFRVNCWVTGGRGGPQIRRSAFLRVKCTQDYYQVCE